MNNNKVTSFGEYIRQLREAAELSLRKVAALLEMDPSLLGKIERNERHPTKEIISGIAKIFNEDEKKLQKEFISDQIAYKILDEEADLDTLKLAEQKI